MRKLFCYLAICLFGIQLAYSQTPYTQRIYVKGTTDVNGQLTLGLKSELLAKPVYKSVVTDENNQDFLVQFEVYGYGEYKLTLNKKEKVRFYAAANDTLEVSYKNGELNYLSSTSKDAAAYQELRQLAPNYAIEVTGAPTEHALKLVETFEEDLITHQGLLEDLSQKHKLSEEYLSFERNQIYYTAALLNLMKRAYIKPKYLKLDKQTGKVSYNATSTTKLLNKIIPEYSLQSPYPNAIHSNTYQKYLTQGAIFSRRGNTVLPIPLGNAEKAKKLLMTEYYDDEGAQLAIFYYIHYSSYNILTYEETYNRLQSAITNPLIKEKLKVSHQDVMAKKMKEEVAQTLPKPIFMTEDLSKRKDFDEYASQFDGKVVYLDIWATGCRGCIANFDATKLLQYKLIQEGYGDKVEFIYLCAEGGEEVEQKWRKTVQKYGLGGQHFRVPRLSRTNISFKAFSMPSYFIRKPDGTWVEASDPRGNAFEQIVEAIEGK